MTTEEFISKAKEIHGDKYDYSKTVYVGYENKLTIFCKNCKIYFLQTPHHHLAGCGCKRCKKAKTGEEVVKQAKEIHGDKYDYSLIDFEKKYLAEEKIKIVCPTHGVFEQTIHRHIGQKQGCPKCAKKYKPTTEEFIKKAKEVHDDKYDYSLVDYKNTNIKIKIICPKHGVFEQEPRIHLKKHGCPKCRESAGEKRIRHWLAKNGYEEGKDYFVQFKFEDCKYKKKLPFDFYVPSKNLLIEYQGEQHYNVVDGWGGLEGLSFRKEKDEIKRQFCKKNGIRELEISYLDFSNIEKILEEEIDNG